tara:strand:+ start:143 stop:1759 length:1617 start_codon:yes stop_codon:yes gene_type:complete
MITTLDDGQMGPIMNIMYDPSQDRMVFPVNTGSIITQNYEEIYEGCTEDISDAFGLNRSYVKKITDLTDEEKNTILDQLKKVLVGNKKYAGCKIHNKKGSIIPIAEEFARLLDAIKVSGCFHLTDKAGKTYGVQPPLYENVQMGLVHAPWKFLYIDFAAQRWTDIYHVIEKLLNFDSKKNLGLTGRFDPEGVHVDINDGRHSAMLLGLTGLPYAIVRGPVCASRSTNMDIFEVLNSQAKPITLYDILNFTYNRALQKKEEGPEGVKAIDRRKHKTGSGKVLSDRQVYEMVELLNTFGIELVPESQGDQNRRNIQEGEWFRSDMILKFIQDPNYTTFNKETGAIEDTYLYESLLVVKEVLVDNGGYAPHELTWAILELFKQTNDKVTLTKATRTKMTNALIKALEEYFSEVSINAERRMAKDRPYEFYKDYNTFSKRIPDSSKVKELSQGKTYIQVFLATALYSIVQNCVGLKKPVKELFALPEIRRSIINDDAEKELEIVNLLDDRGQPIDFDLSFKTKKAEANKLAVDVIEDEVEYV